MLVTPSQYQFHTHTQTHFKCVSKHALLDPRVKQRSPAWLLTVSQDTEQFFSEECQVVYFYDNKTVHGKVTGIKGNITTR